MYPPPHTIVLIIIEVDQGCGADLTLKPKP
jgi:hypothetical protein